MTIANWFTCICTKLIVSSWEHRILNWHHLSVIASQISGKVTVCSTVLGWQQKIWNVRITGRLWRQSIFVGFPLKGPVMRKTFPWHDVIVSHIFSWWPGIQCFDNQHVETWTNWPSLWRRLLQTHFLGWMICLLIHSWLKLIPKGAITTKSELVYVCKLLS